MDERRYVDDVGEFLSLLVRSKLVSKNEMGDLLASYRTEYLPTSRYPDTITAICTFLVERGVVTSWQCGMLRRGQYKGFLLGHFQLLDQLGRDNDDKYFLAEDTETGRHVSLAVTLPAERRDRDIKYRVEREFD